LLTVLAISLLPAAGIIIGCVLAEIVRTPKWLIGASLHATAGIAIAVVSIELMPRILVITPIWVVTGAFLAGAAVTVMLSYIGRSPRRSVAGQGTMSAWMVYAAVIVDLVSDGLMVGAGAAVQTGFGVLIAATQAVANIPGGFAATSNFRDDGIPRARRLVLALSAVPPALLAAVIGFAVLRTMSAETQSAVLAFMVGILLLATVEDVIPEADAPKAPRWISTLAFALGFAALALLSSIVR
jgi:zinc transporter, ZIP family